MTGTAVRKVLDTNKRSESSKKLQEMFSKRIIGQEEAVRVFTNIVEAYQAGLSDPKRPAGNAMFLGPTGSGKTYVVESAAEAMFGNPSSLIKIDCAEFQHSHEIAKLIGSPPGYLGHRETHPMFTQAVLQQYHNAQFKLGIVLFDEIEKASDSLWKLLLGIMDKATLTCGDNSIVNFSQCIIVMTSNLGVSEMNSLMGERIGFMPEAVEVKQTKIEDVAKGAMKRKFDPEFLNRIDNTVVFNTLTEDNMREIMAIELGRALTTVFSASYTTFQLDAKAKETVFTEGFSKEYGARQLKRVIQQRITMPLARILSSDQVKEGEKVLISEVGNSDFEFSILEETNEVKRMGL